MLLSLTLSAVSALLTLFIFYPYHNGMAWVSPRDILVAVLYPLNLLLAIGCLLYSLVKLNAKSPKNELPLVVITLLFSCVMPFTSGCEALYPEIKHSLEIRRYHRDKLLVKWHNLGITVNPLLRAYYRTNPARFKFPHNDDEAEVDGFADYVANQGVAIKHSQLVDPWGDPVHLVVDHNGNFFLEARGEGLGLPYDSRNRLAVGLLLDRPSRVNVWRTQQWSLDDGIFPFNEEK